VGLRIQVPSKAEPARFRYGTDIAVNETVAPMTTAPTSDWNTTLFLRTAYFALSIAAATVLSWSALAAVCKTALHNDQQSHILLILPVSLALLYSERNKMVRSAKYCIPAGIILGLLVGASAWVVWHPLPLSQNDTLSLRMALLIASCVTVFLSCYDVSASRAALFPLLFLFLMAPIPDLVLDRIIWLLQKGSADMAFLLLKAANVPVQRQGMVLGLPGIDIEVARECSGIHSSLVLFIVSLVLGHFFLRSGWRKILLAVLACLVAVAKNGLRIFTLSTLRIYVDPSVLNGDLHRRGGILFFLLALGLLILIVLWFRKSEKSMPNEYGNYPSAVDNPVFVKGGN
jgi:exosortase